MRLLNVRILSLTFAVLAAAGVADASHVPLAPPAMPAWDMDLRFIGYGNDSGFSNDSVANVQTMLAASPHNVGPETGLVQIAKSDGAADGFVYTGLGSTSGTWKYTDLFNILYLVVKAGSNEKFALYELKSPYLTGSVRDWNTQNISSGNSHDVPNLSHLSFYGDGSKVPEPATSTALASIAVVGLFWVRRRLRKRARS